MNKNELWLLLTRKCAECQEGEPVNDACGACQLKALFGFGPQDFSYRELLKRGICFCEECLKAGPCSRKCCVRAMWAYLEDVFEG